MPVVRGKLMDVVFFPLDRIQPSDSRYPSNNACRHSRFIPKTHDGRFFPAACMPKLVVSQSNNAIEEQVKRVVEGCSTLPK